MDSAAGSSTLPHRTVSSIRTGGAQSGGGAQAATPSSPHTPLRSIPSNYGSPSSLRAEEDVVVIEFGSRKLVVGFAGDAVPRGTVRFEPEQQRRVGDFRSWMPGFDNDWRKRAVGKSWGSDYELWNFDVRDRDLDLGVVGDRIERALREAFNTYLLIDSRPRRLMAVLPSLLPTPLLSIVMDTLFTRFSFLSASLLSAPVMTAVAAGVRSALVVDLGWNETTVTAIYEYREIHSSKSVRGGRMLVEQVNRLLAKALAEKEGKVLADDAQETHTDVVSFAECEDICRRMAWCKPSARSSASARSQVAVPAIALPTVHEQDETEHPAPPSISRPSSSLVNIPLTSSYPPTTLSLTYDQLAAPCESAFFETDLSPASFDDHEQPLHQLIYRALLQLPLDARSVCMARLTFTGGGTGVLGLRGRLFDEVAGLVADRGWDPVTGRAVEQYRANPKLKRRGATTTSPRQAAGADNDGDDSDDDDDDDDQGEEVDGVWHDSPARTRTGAGAAGTSTNRLPPEPERDIIEEGLRQNSSSSSQRQPPPPAGELRAVESLGAWSGASLVTQLKVPAIASVDRDAWLQQGLAGASRAGDVDAVVITKAQTQRQSLGPGGLMRGAGGAAASSWTLGVWGAV